MSVSNGLTQTDFNLSAAVFLAQVSDAAVRGCAGEPDQIEKRSPAQRDHI